MSGFVARNKPTWDELEQLVQKARRSIRRMTPDELSRLDILYRRTTIHLAQVSTRTSDRRLTQYLNDLTVAAHSLIYLPPRRGLFAELRFLLTEGIARSIARNWRCHAISAALLLGGALLAYYAALSDPLAAYALWPAADQRQPGSTRDQLLEVLRGGRDDPGSAKFFFSSFLFSNNLRVGLLAMATGVLVGLPTVFLMLYNGMLLGVFAAIHVRAGIETEMWAWILPHGVTELSAIVLCGGVGFMFGLAVLAPGRRTRTEALRAAGREAGVTTLGVAGMLVLAAVIESFLRQSHLSTSARFAFAAATAVFWTLFVLYGFLRERAARRLEQQAAGESEQVAAA
ncbi:MAG TPA: stage II sporulation protein M [Pirellulales bacterium]|jgi:uncharacterized membrane protein SpoIIM required for sporulation|nr:stage II sporulation protein M [Pirellulales bacterium]